MWEFLITAMMSCNLVSQNVINAGTEMNKEMVKQCVFKCQDKSLVYQDTGRYEQCPKILYEPMPKKEEGS